MLFDTQILTIFRAEKLRTFELRKSCENPNLTRTKKKKSTRPVVSDFLHTLNKNVEIIYLNKFM